MAVVGVAITWYVGIPHMWPTSPLAGLMDVWQWQTGSTAAFGPISC